MVMNGQVGVAGGLLVAATFLIAAVTGFESARADAVEQTNRAGSGTISGTVSADDGARLKRARVVLRTERLQDVAAVFTDATGEFLFSGLQAGTYVVAASMPRYVTAAYGQSSEREIGSLIRLGERQAVRNIDVRLQRGAVISGGIVNGSGTPAVGARVYVARADARTGEQRIVVIRETDDRGEFRVWGLAAGDYYLSATPTRASTAAGRRYYPGTTVANDASPVTVKAGQEAGAISFALKAGVSSSTQDGVRVSDSTNGGVISGVVFDDTGDPAVGARVFVRSRSADVSSERPKTTALTNDRGEFRVWGVAPGEYIVSALPMAEPPGRLNLLLNPADYAETYYPGVSSLNGSLPVVLDPAAALGGITFMLQRVRAVEIAGSVVGVDGALARSGAVALVPDEGRGANDSDRSFHARIDADGRFELDRVPAGNYTLEAAAATREGMQYGAESLSIFGDDLSNLRLTVRGLRTVSGTITWDSAAPGRFAPQALRITAPRVRETLGAPVAAAQISPTGTFRLRDVLPGAHVRRVENVPAGWILQSVFIGSREATGQEVDVQGDRHLDDLRLVFTHREP
jgi:Carboxypeptidase regulatory-like domain